MPLLTKNPEDAVASGYTAERIMAGPGTSVESRVNRMTDSDSNTMKRAAARGEATAAKRGLMNTSMAAGASQAAMIDAATPIAQQDAQTTFDIKQNNQAAGNQAKEFNAGAKTDVSKLNAQEKNRMLLSEQQMREKQLLSTQEFAEDKQLSHLDFQEQKGLNTQQNKASMDLQGLQGEQKLDQQEQMAGFEKELTNLDAQIATALAKGDHVRAKDLQAQKAQIETKQTNLEFQIEKQIIAEKDKDLVANMHLEHQFATQDMVKKQQLEVAMTQLDARIATAVSHQDFQEEKSLLNSKAVYEQQLENLDHQNTMKLATKEGQEAKILENVKATNMESLENVKAANEANKQDIQNTFDNILANKEISAEAATQVADFLNQSGQQYTTQAIEVAKDTNLTIGQKRELMASLFREIRMRATLVADVHDVKLDYGNPTVIATNKPFKV